MSRPRKNEKLDKLKGQRVKQARERKKMSIENLAEEMGMKDATLQSKRENGIRGFNEEQAKAYAEILDVPFEYIWSGLFCICFAIANNLFIVCLLSKRL